MIILRDTFHAYHFLSTILSAFVPVCAATSFFRSPIVSSGLGNISQGTSPAKINLTHVQKSYNAIVSGSPCDSNLRVTRILAFHSDFLP